ncbi:hemagglutinin repeat-containing protein, partial [Achromobacter ruhlandii]
GGPDSNLTVRGSGIRAGGDAVLKADGDINLLAARNTFETDRKSSSVSAGVGVAISVGQNGLAFGVTANASGARGRGEGRDVTWTNSHVTAGERLALESGGDTRLRGAVASGRQVVADAGGNLSIESLQDTSSFKSSDTQIGGSVTAGVGFAASGSYASNKVDGDFASVVEQSRLDAGDDGFTVRVQGNTDLKGAAIASSEVAVKRGVNTVTTGSLSVSDIENRSRYKATGVSLSGGFSVAGDDKASAAKKEGSAGKEEGGASKAGEAAASNVAGKGDAWSARNFGNSVSAGAPGMSVRKGSESSVTHSGISGAAVTITDMNAQWERTGKTAEQVLAMLDRGARAGDGAGGLTKKWDADKLRRQVQAEAEIVAAFGQQAGAAIERHAEQKRAELRQQIKATQDPEKIKALQAQINEINTQERLLNVAVGALGGSAGVAALQAGLSEAADHMRRYTIADSEKFAGITDGETTLDNKSGESAGIRGDGFKTAGTRVVLDILCGPVNQRCKKEKDFQGKEILDENGIPKLELDGNGLVRFDRKAAKMTMAEFLETDPGKEMSGPTGGNQGGPGTLLGLAYSPGGILDLAHEAYGGSHDFISGSLSGFYDEQGNARRGLTPLQKGMYETWTGIALVPATPFALSEALPPHAWKALEILLRMNR